MDDTHIPGQEAVLKIPIAAENIREELNFYKTLKDHFKIYGKPTDDLDFIIKNLEDQIADFEAGSPIRRIRNRWRKRSQNIPISKIPAITRFVC